MPCLRNLWPSITCALTVLFAAPAAIAGLPAQAEPIVFPATGGDSISGSGEWSIIADGDTQKCDLIFYRLNFATMAWEFYQVVDSGNTNFCNLSSFGDSASLNGNVLVVGGPSYDGGLAANCPVVTDAGAVILFAFDGTDWAVVDFGTQQSCGQGTILRSPSPSASEAFGSSVSVSPNPGVDGQYLVAIGAPGYDGANPNSGRAYTYIFDQGVGSVTHQGQFDGVAENENLGFAVTTKFPYALAGAPGYDSGGFTDNGRAVLFDGTFAPSPTLPSTIPGDQTNQRLGGEVSLSDDFMLIAGDISATVIPGPAEWTGAVDTIPPFDGDVSQSGGVAALGQLGVPPAPGGATLFRDVVTDDAGDGIPADLSSVSPLASNLGFDIRMVLEFLWFADPDNDRAIVVGYPCSLGRKLIAGVWAIVSVPCNVPGTVGEVFDAAIEGSYEIYELDDSIAHSTNPYRIPLPGEPVRQGRAYWIKAEVTQYLAFTGVAGQAAPTFTTSVAPLAATGAIPVPASVRRQRAEILPRPTPLDAAGAYARVMVANPFSRSFTWPELFYQNGSDVTHISEQPTKIKPYGYLYDPDDMVGQPYQALTHTPPFNEIPIRPNQGFWIQVEADSDTGADGGRLLLPLSQ